MRRRLLLAAILASLASVGLAGCGDDEPEDGLRSIIAGDHYGEYELLAEYQDGEYTGCMRMNYEDGLQCAEPDELLAVFDHVEEAVYGSVPEGGTALVDGEPLELIDDRFILLLEGHTPGDVSLAD